MRAGPSTAYPVVVGLPSRAALSVHGCTTNTSWCDVSWGRERGWVSANYVQVVYRGVPTVVAPVIAPAVGITVVSFNETYWNTYYFGRPWYGQWNAYYRRGAHSPRGGAVAGCNDRGCGGAAISPGHVAFGHCTDGTCSGTSMNRGPLGHVRVRHGSLSRD
ncbi:SH3 domain-containing protein [Rhizobium sp. NPDC090275]|uniref:SH3 domain-containing protein n=1 Tax=Rhizobium sp. NPDC090275 TaxID=3364498 RepID=UPI00383A166E